MATKLNILLFTVIIFFFLLPQVILIYIDDIHGLVNWKLCFEERLEPSTLCLFVVESMSYVVWRNSYWVITTAYTKKLYCDECTIPIKPWWPRDKSEHLHSNNLYFNWRLVLRHVWWSKILRATWMLTRKISSWHPDFTAI